jgi:EAL domain-containing protein (putative c-di-GMP-specific phosphodiesterase class I)
MADPMSNPVPPLTGEESPSPAAPQPGKGSVPPLCLVVDEESSVRQFISLILHGLGIETVELTDGAALRAVRVPRAPDLIFHNISLDSADAIESLLRLNQHGYSGPIQLMSRRGAAVLEHVRKVGLEHKLNMLPALKKPFGGDAIVEIVQGLKLGLALTAAANANLDDALARNWIEFWHQPVIDLRRKRLVGAEMYARIRHPEAGIILPAGFMPSASPASTFKLAELAVESALKAGSNYAKLGINLPITVNIPLDALEKLPIEKLVVDHHSHATNWPGLNIDIAEEQIITNLGLAAELAKKLARVNVRIAIDNFGKGYSSLRQIKELPFAQIKLDRAFIMNCGTDTVNAPLCKTMIDLAHNFGQLAVAMGIENADDALALVTMGCDYGQGFLLGQPMPEAHFTSLLRQRGLKKKDRKAAAAAA